MVTPTDLPTRSLGRGGPSVSAIGFGGVPLSCPASRPTEEDAIEVLRHAVRSGITLIDTADSYCRHSGEYGHNERLVGTALAGLPGDVRERVVVGTKAGWSRPGGRWIPRGDPRWLRERCEAALVNLRTDRIDLFHHHVIDPEVPAEDSLGALVRLREEGKIRHLGLSNYPVEEAVRCLPLVDAVSLQVQLSPWNSKPLHDGTLDLLTAAPGTLQPLAWHANAGGDGSSFDTSAIPVTVQPGPAVAAADLDRDGDLDALSVRGSTTGGERVLWHPNTDGAGSFGVAAEVASLLPGARGLAAADVDGDGDPDVVAASQSPGNRVSWHENVAGDASLWVPHVVSVGTRPVLRVDAADLDFDGDADLLAAGSDAIAWYENLAGDGSVWAPRPLSAGGPLLLGAAVRAADVDGDGDLDVLGGDALGAEVSWFENRSLHRSARFPQAAAVVLSAAPGARAVAAADLDGDGDLDTLTSIDPDRLVWLENADGAGGAWSLADIDAAFAGGADAVAAADLDRDGDLDAVAASAGDDRVAWFENLAGDGSAWSTHTVTTALDAPHGLDVRDADGDGDPDLLVASGGDRQLTYLANLAGDGSTWLASTVAGGVSGGVGRPDSGDVDGDGDADVLWSFDDTAIVWLDNASGDAASWTLRAIATAAAPVGAAVAADVDGDGDLDAVVGTGGLDDQVAWHENTAGGGLTWAVHAIGAADEVTGLWAADLDADGDLDVAAASSADDAVRWFENTAGDGSAWTARTPSTTELAAGAVVAADLDGDGARDLLAVAAGDGRVSLLPNRGGQFGGSATALATSLLEGGTAAALRFEAFHRGRAGDGDAELATVRLRFTDATGAALSSAQANALFAAVAVHRDDGSGVFEAGSDALVASASPLALDDGVLALAAADGDAAARFALAAPATFFAVVTAAPDAGSAAPHLFRIAHDEGVDAEDADFDVPLDREWSEPTQTEVVGALDPLLDQDADGLSNADEMLVHGTDPLAFDSDGDGFGDGGEIAAGTDPNDPQSFPPATGIPAGSGAWRLLLALGVLALALRARR